MGFDSFTRTPPLPSELQGVREPWRFRRTRLAPLGEFVASILFFLHFAATVLLVFFGAISGRIWMMAAGLVLGIGGYLVGSRLYRRAVYRQMARDAARLAALEQRGPGPGSSYTFEGNAPVAWPLFLTTIAVVCGVLAWCMTDPIFGSLTVLVLIPAAAISWLVALRRRGVLLELSPVGVRIAGHDLPWSSVANVRLVTHYREPAPHLHIDLNDPLPTAGWIARVISFLSRGAADREVSISLRYAAEPASAVFEITHQYWEKVVGRDIPFVAAGREIARYQRDLRKISERTPAERRRLVLVVLALFGLIAWCWQSMQISFWTSPGWWGPSWWISAAFTGGGLAWLLRHRGLASLRNRQGPAMYIVMFLFVLAMLTCVSWLIIGRSLPDIATRLTGSRHETFVEMRKTVKAGSGDCSLRISSDEMERRFPSAYCADPGEFARLPDSGTMRVISRESWFGRHIDRIEPVDAVP